MHKTNRSEAAKLTATKLQKITATKLQKITAAKLQNLTATKLQKLTAAKLQKSSIQFRESGFHKIPYSATHKALTEVVANIFGIH